MYKKIKNYKQELILSFLGAVIIVFFALFFFSQERTIYYWDEVTFWNKYIYLLNVFKESPLKLAQVLIVSIKTDEYNLLSTLPLIPIGLILGSSRISYITSLVFTYVFIFFISSFVFLKKNFELRGSVTKKIIFLVILLTLPNLWIPILMGFPDIFLITLQLCLLTFYFIFFQVGKKKSLFVNVCFIFSILILLLFRRYSLFWFVAFSICTSIDLLLRKNFKALKVHTFLLIVSYFIYFLVRYPNSANVFSLQYLFIFQGYNNSKSLLGFLLILSKSLGLFYIGFLLLVISNKYKDRKVVLCFSISFLSIIFFSLFQDLGAQHFYLFLPSIIVSTYLLLIDKKTWQVFIVILFMAMNFLCVFKQCRVLNGNPFFSDIKFLPRTRTDLKTFSELMQTLDSLESKNPGMIYLIASSHTINSSILQGYCWQYYSLNFSDRICSKILFTSDIDIRDGFPDKIYDVKYILVADPPQLHLNEAVQKNIIITHDFFSQPENIKNYEIYNEKFLFMNEVQLTLLIKKDQLSMD